MQNKTVQTLEAMKAVNTLIDYFTQANLDPVVTEFVNRNLHAIHSLCFGISENTPKKESAGSEPYWSVWP